jgi:hypothetical protein
MTRPLAKTAAALLGLTTLTLASPAGAQPGELKLDLRYDGRLFIKVLEINLSEHITASGHGSSARIASYGILDAFKHFNIDASESGRMVHGDPEPGVFKHFNHDGKRNRQVEVTWGPGDVTTASTPTMDYLGDPPATREQRLGAVGYLTAVMRLTVAADKGPCSGSERVFNGKELSELGFADPKPVELSGSQKKLGLVNGVRCSASFREIAGYKKKKGKAQNQGLDRPIQVDFAQAGEGGPWVLAKLQAHTQLGNAVIELGQVKMDGKLPDGIVQAAR